MEYYKYLEQKRAQSLMVENLLRHTNRPKNGELYVPIGKSLKLIAGNSEWTLKGVCNVALK